MGIFTEIFAWWTGNTIGMRTALWRYGAKKVGEDEFGNVYYSGNVPPLGERRWVVYRGEAEASRIPAGWHGWMHFTVDTPPGQDGYKPAEWHAPHRPNLTGTPAAYHPKGSVLAAAGRPKVTDDYEAWTPGA